ncbi:MAG: ABC transporter permease subunit [Tepidiformaceae bacterium]
MRKFGLIRKSLRDQRLAAILVGATSAAIALMLILIFPSYRDSLKDFEIPSAMEAFLGEAGSITTPEGFLSAEFFSWVPLLLLTLAIIGGTGAIAGEEGAGTLDLLLAQPIRRWRLLVDKAAGLTLGLLIATLSSYPGFLIAKLFVDFDLSSWRILESVAYMFPVTFLFLALSMLCAAVAPGRGGAATAAIGIVVATYFLNLIAPAADFLEQPRKLSPFYWSEASRVLIHGFDYVRASGLLAFGFIFLGLAAWVFERREIAAGGREWSLHLPFRHPRVEHGESRSPSASKR